MHIYLYDQYVNEKRFEATVARIETRITDLGLNGKIVRLGMINSVMSAIENEVRKGAKTIVAVGGIKILSQAASALANLQAQYRPSGDVPLGFIPVGKEAEELGAFLGIPREEQAADVLSQRRLERLDLGQANDQFFIFTARISTANTKVEIDGEYSLEIMHQGTINVINLPFGEDLPREAKSSATDSALELYIKTKGKKKVWEKGIMSQSVFPFKRLRVINQVEPLLLDELIPVKSPVEVMAAKEKLNFIVGKNRKF